MNFIKTGFHLLTRSEENFQRLFFACYKTQTTVKKASEKAAPFGFTNNTKLGLRPSHYGYKNDFRIVGVFVCVGRTNGRSHPFVLDLFVSFSIKRKRKERNQLNNSFAKTPNWNV